jgi:hypothetical protein
MRTLTRLLLASTAMASLAIGSAKAAPILVTGSYTVSYTPSVGNAPTLFDVLPGAFTENLTVGVSTAFTNFIGVTPANSCGSCGSNHTASGTIAATFHFTTPSGITGTASDTGAYIANYSNDTDSVTWNPTDPIVVHFIDGAVLDVTLGNAQDWTIYPTIKFVLVSGPTPAPVPEPVTLSLFGTGLLGLGVIKRRRRAV